MRNEDYRDYGILMEMQEKREEDKKAMCVETASEFKPVMNRSGKRKGDSDV